MSDSLPASAEFVIAGAGFAGAATAAFLARAGVRDALVLEAEDQPGEHASGLNAALLRRLVPDPVTGAALRRSVRLVRDQSWGDEVAISANGSLLLVGEGGEGQRECEVRREGERIRGGSEERGCTEPESYLEDTSQGSGGPRDEAGARRRRPQQDRVFTLTLEDLDAAVDEAAADGVPCTRATRDEAIARVPVLASAAFDRAILTADDGVVDINALLWRYLRAARAGGARLATSCPVVAVETAGGRVAAVRTPRGRVACRVLVDAAGAWANTVAGLAGLEPLRMAPWRRHLAVTPPVPFVDASWPFVWDVAAGWYFRPEVGGLLLSACDQTEVPAAPAVRDPSALDLLAEKLARHVPALAGLAVKRWWAGLRTIAADGRFAIGPDPRLRGFFWVAGLGGHGMTGSAFAGEAAARLILGHDEPLAAALAPGRLA